jgi:hypothetical protein
MGRSGDSCNRRRLLPRWLLRRWLPIRGDAGYLLYEGEHDDEECVPYDGYRRGDDGW